MPRWTIRGVAPEAVRAVQQVQDEIGASLGEIVATCIAIGLAPARQRLKQSAYPKRHRAEVMALQQAIQRAISSVAGAEAITPAQSLP